MTLAFGVRLLIVDASAYAHAAPICFVTSVVIIDLMHIMYRFITFLLRNSFNTFVEYVVDGYYAA